MDAMQAVKTAANNAGVPITHIGVSMGKARTYANTAISKGATPQADTLAKMLGVCGYALCAVPDDEIPEHAIVIDA